MNNSEDDVLAAIDQLERDAVDDLVDRQLQQTRSGYDNNINQDKCELCGSLWHGLKDLDTGCPGPYGTDEEKAAYVPPSPALAGFVSPATRQPLREPLRPTMGDPRRLVPRPPPYGSRRRQLEEYQRFEEYRRQCIREGRYMAWSPQDSWPQPPTWWTEELTRAVAGNYYTENSVALRYVSQRYDSFMCKPLPDSGVDEMFIVF